MIDRRRHGCSPRLIRSRNPRVFGIQLSFYDRGSWSDGNVGREISRVPSETTVPSRLLSNRLQKPILSIVMISCNRDGTRTGSAIFRGNQFRNYAHEEVRTLWSREKKKEQESSSFLSLQLFKKKSNGVKLRRRVRSYDNRRLTVKLWQRKRSNYAIPNAWYCRTTTLSP